jgi:hypothetical protein
MNNFQRIGSVSNSHVGRDFESVAHAYFLEVEGLPLTRSFAVVLGVGATRKCRRFDFGLEDPSTLVECKSHRWTETGNMPSAKVTVWNESMFYFHLAPGHYRKVLFVLRDVHPRRNQSLAEYYVRNYAHLIPEDVSIVEFDEVSRSALLVRGAAPRIALPPAR